MAPTQMKLRVRRRGRASGAAAAAGRQPEEEEVRTRPSGRRKSSSRPSASPSPPGSSSVSTHAGLTVAEDASPDSKCPICLDRFNNLAYLDRCLHRFCFPCIQEWSHNKAECPLCKQPFASILHSVRAEDDFKEYTLQPAPNTSSVAATVAMVAAMASAARSNHQMRLMLRRHRGVHAVERRRRRRERRGRRRSGSRTRERVSMGEWFLDSSVPLPAYPPASPVLTDRSDEADDLDEQPLSEGAASPDGGVIFEGMMRLGGAAVPLTSSSRDSRRMMSQLAARRRMQQDSGAARQVRERETVAFRRSLYRCGIRAAGIQGQPQQQHDVSAESFRRNPELLDRLQPWLRRELTVLYGAHGSLVDIIQRIIVARLARHGLEDTPTIEEELRPFLLARTDHFLHELLSFARCRLSLERYDLQALYEPPAAAQLEAISSSSDRESIIAISEGEEEQGLLGGDQDRAGGAGRELLQTRSSLSQSAWDDETPGPSYSAAEPSCSLSSLSFSPAPQEAANEEDGEKEEEEEECLIVGYKKPMAERTPELVQLSSDSQEEQEEEKTEGDKPPVSTRTTPPPRIPPSTSGTHPKGQEEELKEKDEEACQPSFRAGSSRSSTCGPERQEPGEERRREERRPPRSAREQERRRSGTLLNPNRCIYPAMLRQRSRSSSPFQSGAESSPPDSSWEYSCSQLSPLASSASSPSRISWCSSPPRSPPPPPSGPPGECGEKPGGKRKYKSRHLDSAREEPSWKQRSSSRRRERRRERKKKERRRRPRPEGRRRERSRRSSEGGGRRSRDDRSPSVEIIYEGPVGADATPPPARKRRRKQEPGSRAGSCPIIITLDSDGSQDGLDAGVDVPQTLDVSELLPLPLPPEDVPQTPDVDGGQPAVGLLDQEPPRRPRDVEGCGLLLGPEEGQRSEVLSGGQGGRSRAAVSDSCLLASILGDLRDAAQRPPPHSPVGQGSTEASGPPPLLRQVSPVRSYSRNTPPPLKRSDAPSPRPSHDRAPAAAGTSERKPGCPPGPVAGSPSRKDSCPGSPLPGAPRPHHPSTSTEGRKERPPGAGGSSGVNHSRSLEDFVSSSEGGAEGGAEGGPSPTDEAAPGQLCSTASPALTRSTNSRSLSPDGGCRSSQISSSAAAGAEEGAGAPSVGEEEPPPAHLQSTRWKCGVSGAAPPFARHSDVASSAGVGAGASSDLLLQAQEAQPPVGSH